ncbi:hypothetical protein [Laedolimicola sp.]|uniref:hypothetical protein n=1 Tax=Laedolimicola sp. TaxID=2981663 RepID=UPI003F82177A
MNKIEKIKKVGATRTLKLLKDRIISPLVEPYCRNRWERLAKKKEYVGINTPERKIPIIVSLTTFPARIENVHWVVKTLLVQSLKPDKIILWLAIEQFPNKENDLPDSLLKLQRYGLTISWCNDIRSYKKLIPTIKEYPNSYIITADDDIFYHPKMIERLFRAYKRDPLNIHCHRVTKFYLENGEFKTIPGGYEIYNHPSFLHKLTGGSGTLYPPNSLYKDICREDLFMKLTPTNDDIWFWVMAILNGKRCNVVKHSCTALYYINGSQEKSLSSINDNGEKLFWKQFTSIMEYYPEAKKRLIEEWNKEGSN